MSKRLQQQKPAVTAAAAASKSKASGVSLTRPKKKQTSPPATSSTKTPSRLDRDVDEDLTDDMPDMLERLELQQQQQQQEEEEPETLDQLNKRLLDRLLPSSSFDEAADCAAEELSGITHARLDRAKLTNLDCFPHLWPSGNCVTHLYLQHNRLESLLPGIDLLPSLVFLTVAHNRLRALTGLADASPGLRFLDASHNDLTRLDPGQDLPQNLFILCLQGNPCRGYRRAVLARLQRLHQLDLRILNRRDTGGDSERLPTDSEDEDDDDDDDKNVDGDESAVDDDVARMLRVARQCLGEPLDDDDGDDDEEVEEEGIEDNQEALLADSVRALAGDILMRSQSRLESMMLNSGGDSGDGSQSNRRQRFLLAASMAESIADDQARARAD